LQVKLAPKTDYHCREAHYALIGVDTKSAMFPKIMVTATQEFYARRVLRESQTRNAFFTEEDIMFLASGGYQVLIKLC
jgi:hypothetical protein